MNENEMKKLTETELEGITGGAEVDENGSTIGMIDRRQYDQLVEKFKEHPFDSTVSKENSTPIRPGIFK